MSKTVNLDSCGFKFPKPSRSVPMMIPSKDWDKLKRERNALRAEVNKLRKIIDLRQENKIHVTVQYEATIFSLEKKNDRLERLVIALMRENEGDF